MKKILFCLALILFIPVVKAGSFSISASSTNISVGQSVTIYVSVNDAAGKFNASSNNSGVLAFNDDANNVWIDNGSSSFKFTAKSAGKATVTITPSDCAGYDEKEITSSKSITITVNTPSNNTGGNSNNGGNTTQEKRTTVSEKPKSSINYLSNLGIEGIELTPKFDKETTEYEATLPNETKTIKIIGEKEDEKSNIIGLGEVNVSEGINTINVEVTAENGAKKTYTIKATVEEKAPIIVNVDGKQLTLIRKAEQMPQASDYYVLGNITIEENEIPAYTSETTKYTLVALKDETGNIELYKYDNNTYKKYTEFGFSPIKISPLEPTEIPEGYTEETIKINEKEIKAYKKEGKLPLIYGINIETGETNFYTYDEKEGTIQKLIIEEKEKNNYPIIIIGLVGLSLAELIAIICILSSKNKKLKKEYKTKLETKTEFEKETPKETEQQLGKTALISSNVGNVFNNSKNIKEEKKQKNKKQDDDMYKF